MRPAVLKSLYQTVSVSKYSKMSFTRDSDVLPSGSSITVFVSAVYKICKDIEYITVLNSTQDATNTQRVPRYQGTVGVPMLVVAILKLPNVAF